jgi:anti-sigma B factor antagonist
MAFLEPVREGDGDIKIAGLQPRVFTVFDLLGFPLLFDIVDTEDDAVARFNDTSEKTSEDPA